MTDLATPAPGLADGADREASSTALARRALWAVVAVSAVVIVVADRRQWFGGDEYFILLDRGLRSGPGRFGLFEAHFEHWTTIPILAYRALYWAVGLRTYWPYLALVIVAHLVVVVLLWHVMVRARIDAWVALCACAVFSVLGVGFETLTGGWIVTLVAPIALGLAALLLVPEAGPFTRRDAGVVGLLLLALMCSGVALPMLAVIVLMQLVRRGWRVAALTAVVPAVVYAAWYVAYHDTGLPLAVDPAPGEVPHWMWRGVTGALGDVARLSVIGVVVVVALAGWLAWQLGRRPRDRNLLVPCALAGGALLFLASTGWRRGNLLSVGPTSSRYAYVTVALMLPLLAMAGQSLFRGSTLRRAALVVVTLLLVGAQVRLLYHWAGILGDDKQHDRSALLATAALAREGIPFLPQTPQTPLSIFEPQVTVAKIVEMDRAGKLGSLSGVTLRDKLTVLARLNLALATEPPVDAPASSPTHLRSLRNAHVSATPGEPGCVAIDAGRDNEIVVRPDGPTTLRLVGNGVFDFRLRDGHTDGEVFVPMWPADVPQRFLTVGAVPGDVVVSVPPGRVQICGLAV